MHLARLALARCSTLLLAAPLLALCGCGSGASSAGLTVIGTASLTSALTFATVTGTPSAMQTAVLTNTGGKPVVVSGVSLAGANPGSFAQNSACAGTLLPGATCNIAVTFASATAGMFSAQLIVADDIGSQSTTLTGTATAPATAPAVTLSAGSISFGSLVAGGTSAAQTLTLTNSGNAPLALASITVSGPGANLFPSTNTCAATLAAGASCTLSTTFAPRVSGNYAGAITVTSNAANSPQSIALSGAATAAAITIDTSNASDWKISNGAMTLDWNSLKGNVFGLYLNGQGDNLVDTGHTSGGQPFGLYMDNVGLGGGTPVSTYTQGAGYLDWSISYASGPSNAYTWSEHFVVTPNDPGIHLYLTASHAASDIAGSIGQIQWLLRDSLTLFPNTYAVDPSINSPGAYITNLPDPAVTSTSDPGRNVQDATEDLHGFTLPSTYTRSFYTKYDFAGYEYLHKAHGLFGSKYGVWTVLPSTETLSGGPSKQNLDFTGNILMGEVYSNHELNGLSLASPAGTATQRLFGPLYLHVNTFGPAYTVAAQTLNTPADMYADALAASAAAAHTLYDTEAQLLAAGYTASTARGGVTAQIAGVAGAPRTAWAVLSDPGKNFEYSSAGSQYWQDISASGAVNFTGVVPGTYRLSVYALGQWGEFRKDGVVVAANGVTAVGAQTFVPENFSTATPIFTIGTADRSSHEFLHGHTTDGANAPDDREFSGAWNYWKDFAATGGIVNYNATAGPAGPATNDLSKWNYNHWGLFDPGLYAAVYNAADTTTDGYIYAIPAYVAALPGATGTNGVLTKVPPWQVHFTTPAPLTGALPPTYAVLSVSLACTEASYIATLNGQTLIWHSSNASDCMIRSGLSGYTQWFTLQWDASVLSPTGQDNVLQLSVSQNSGDSEDALRMELTNTSADPALRGWNDFEYIYRNTDTRANDAVPNP